MRRKCGTCRYWEEAGIANSGTCTHPQRSDLKDVLLVRRNELACRNPWDADLWQPRPGLEAEDSEDHDEFDANDSSDIAEVPQPAAPLENPTDTVTDVAVRRRVGQMPRPHGWPYSTHHQSDSLDQKSHHEAQETPFRVGVDDVAAWLDEPAMGHAGSQTVDFGSHGSAGSSSHSWTPGDHSYTEQLSPIAGGSQAAEVEPSLDVPPTFLQPTDPLPDIKEFVEDQSEAPTEPSPSVLTDNASFEIRPESPTFTPQPSSPPSAPQPARRPKQSTDPIDSVPWASSIPRCCETCRDFRRNQDGATGVCTNSWAFADQTNAVVKSGQLACRSSIGVWWLPNDDAWRGKFDTEERTRPTPRLDELLRDRDRKRYREHGD